MKINIQVVSFLTHFRCNISRIDRGRDLEEMLHILFPQDFQVSGVWISAACGWWYFIICFFVFGNIHTSSLNFFLVWLHASRVPPPPLLTKNDKVPPVNHPLEEGLAGGAASLRSASKGGPSSLGWLTGGT